MTNAGTKSNLTIKLPPEPLSDVGGSAIVECDAGRQLKSELARYIIGEISGRSFLIAGHRGSGKTTMVRHVVESLNAQIRSAGVRKDIRQALYVPLHGPGMLEFDEHATQADKIRGVLDRITSGLYVAAAEEVAVAFNRMLQVNQNAIQTYKDLEARESFWSGSRRKLRRERVKLQRSVYDAELVAKVRLELDEMPSLSTLRELWRRGGVLKDGVLFEGRARGSTGADEIEVLVTAWRAMKQFVVKGNDLVDRKDATAQSKSGGITLDGKSFVPSLLGLLTGLLVWGGLGQTTDPVQVLLSAASGLFAAMGLTWSATHQRDRSWTRTEKFEFIDDPKALYRILPVLVRRFHRIGVYPVFVVDELDKVAGIDSKVQELLGYLKQFVTENAFFCFLTDRGYYHLLEVESMRNAYSRKYTQFADRLFVRYDLREMRQFLDKLVRVVGDATGDDESARAILPLVLLQHSGAHPYDLRRSIMQWTDDNGTLLRFRSSTEIYNRLQSRVDVTLQVAMEAVFHLARRDGDIDDPLLAQLLLDAQLLFVRSWRNGATEFSDDAQWLRPQLVQCSHVHEEKVQSDTSPQDTEVVSEATLQMLRTNLEKLANFLAAPSTLLPLLTELDFPEVVAGILQQMDPLIEVEQ